MTRHVSRGRGFKMLRECTCAGQAPGFPQHESWCGQREDRGGPYNRWSHPDANLPTETPKDAA